MEHVAIHAWHWVVVFLVLMGMESLVGAGGILLGGALSGILMAMLTGINSHIHWTNQVIIFVVLTIGCTYLYWFFFLRFGKKNGSLILNNRAAQMHGTTFELPHDIPNHVVRIPIGDTLWKIKSKTSLAQGMVVEVYGNKGMTLLVHHMKENQEAKTN